MNEEKPVALNTMPDLIRALQSKAFSDVDNAGCGCMGTHDCNGYGPHIEQTRPTLERLAELRRQLGELEGPASE